MSTAAYGQREPMENEAMAHTLETQALAIWPQEKPFLRRIFSRTGLDVLDVGCGTGEISSRIVREFSPRGVTGVDLAEVNLRRARSRFGPEEYPGLSFLQGDATSLQFPDNRFDMALCRHMLQAVPEPGRVVREMIRVVKPGGWLYFLAEDYGMLFFHPTRRDTDEFFREYGGKAAATSGSNLRHGRTMPSELAALGCADLEVNYLCIDTLRVDRNLLAEIFVHWRDGFERWISSNSGYQLEDVRDRFNDMIECTMREDGYSVWLIPSISARVTEETKKLAAGSGREGTGSRS